MELTIDRVTSGVFSKDYFPQKKPAIVTDVIPTWKAHKTWSLEYLAKSFKDKSVEVAVSPKLTFDYNADGTTVQASRRMSFPELVSRITGPKQGEESYYLLLKSLPQELPELLHDIRTPPWINVTNPIMNLWVGAAETRSPLHYDLSNNFFAQMYGSKHFALFDPSQTAYLYPYPPGQKQSHFSRINMDAPDLVAYPEFKKARAITFTVGPGDLLFLPAYWWHRVRAISASVSLNFWWPPDVQQHLTLNGIRQLWVDYEQDRLRSLRETLLAPSGLNWIDAATLVKPIEKLGSVLLIGAAIEEYIRELHVKSKLSDNSARLDLDAACVQLRAAGRLSEQHSKSILEWNAVVSRAREGRDVTEGEVSALIAQVRNFLTSAA